MANAVLTQKGKTKIFIVDDHAIVREALVDLFSGEKHFDVVGSAEDEVDALQLLRKVQPDIALVDLTLKNSSGISLVQKIRSLYSDIRIIILSAHDDEVNRMKAFISGADEYISKSESPEKILEMIRKVQSQTNRSLGSSAARMLRESHSDVVDEMLSQQLTPSEIDILETIKDGRELKEAARVLTISSKTLECHLSRIYLKLEVSNRCQAIYKALQLNLISLNNCKETTAA